jgi:hypothetical protein
MKAFLLAAVAFSSFTLAIAQEDKKPADPVGTWACKYKIGDMERTATLMIKREGDKKDGDKFEGTMTWPEQKDEKLKDVKFKEGKLTFSAVRKFMDNEIPIDYTFTVEGDVLKGKGAAEFGGNKQEFDIEAKREMEKKDK